MVYNIEMTHDEVIYYAKTLAAINKIQAIKFVRHCLSMSLIDAKNFVEAGFNTPFKKGDTIRFFVGEKRHNGRVIVDEFSNELGQRWVVVAGPHLVPVSDVIERL